MNAERETARSRAAAEQSLVLRVEPMVVAFLRGSAMNEIWPDIDYRVKAVRASAEGM